MDEVSSFLFNLFPKILLWIFKTIFKIIIFTGFWISMILVFLIDQVLITWVFHINLNEKQYPNIYPTYETGLFILMAIPVIICTGLNLYRIISRNPNSILSILLNIFLNKEKKYTDPTVPSQMLSSVPEGVIFGHKHKKYVCKSESVDGHILVVGGAGSGKSSCIAIPSLISWQQRIFAIDIKGELSEKTGSQHPSKRIFNPLLSDSPGYNPYYLLKYSRNPAQDANEISFAIIAKPENLKETFWVDGARNLLTGSMIHFFVNGYSFIETIQIIQSTPIQTLINEIYEGENAIAKMYINQFIDMDIKTLSGIYSELSNHIMLFATDLDIRYCLSKNDNITPEDLEKGKDIFLNIPEDKIEQWKPLLTLIINQFLRHFERRPNEYATPILFLLDEFPRLGKVETSITGLATLRSKKITMALFVQSLAQLDAIYGNDNRKVIADNCQYKAILNATDADTQEYFSRLVGTYDKNKKSQSANYEQYTGMGKGTGTSRTSEERRIIKPEEFATLKNIVLLSPFGFFRIQKTPYYETKEFKV